MVAVGDSGACIQLLAPIDESSTIAKFLDRSGPGLQQLAYRVSDLDQVSAVLRERGLDGQASEIGGGPVLEASEQASDRSASTGDDDRSGHEASCDSERVPRQYPGHAPTGRRHPSPR